LTEDFDTPDLQEAKALLEVLHASPEYAFGPHNLVGGEGPELAQKRRQGVGTSAVP